MRTILFVYLILINAASFLLMHIDKKKAVRHQWRIPEAVLIGISAVGGSLGGILGMLVFRHKIRKPRFYLGLPLLLILHTYLAVQAVFLFR